MKSTVISVFSQSIELFVIMAIKLYSTCHNLYSLENRGIKEIAVIAHIFHPGVRIWSVSVSCREIEVFSSQA